MCLSKNFVKLVLVLILFGSSYLLAQPNWKWTKGFGLPYNDLGNCVTSDSSENIFLCGEFQFSISGGGTLTFPGGVTMTSQGNADYFITKFNKDGTALWARTAGSGAGAFTERGYGVALDNSGNVFTGGVLFRTTTWQGGANPNITFTCYGNNLNGFTAKYNPSGDLLWVQQIGDFLQVQTNKIAVDPSGNVINVGYFGSATTDTLRILRSGIPGINLLYGTLSRDWFIVKSDNDGNYLWAMSAGNSANTDVPNGVTTDASGNIYVCGSGIGDPFNIGGNTLHPDTVLSWQNKLTSDIIIAKISPSGSVLWAKNYGGHNTDMAYGIALDGLGHLYVSGEFDSAAVFGSLGTVYSNGNKYCDAFLLKMDTDGNPIWVRTGGGTTVSSSTTIPDCANSIAIDKAGNPWICGKYNGTGDFSGSIITSAGGNDVFIAQYDTAGNLLTLKSGGGTGPDNGLFICASPSPAGDIITSGSFNSVAGGVDFGPDHITGVGNDDMFISKLGLRTLSLTARIQGFTDAGTGLMVSDTVTAELHNSSSPYTTLESQKGVLNTSGAGTFNFSTAVSGTPYYLAIKHRNSVETWSAAANSFTAGDLSYDFTTANAQSYGPNMVQVGSKWCLYSGDVSQDGQVTFSDLIAVDNANTNFVTGYTNTDLTGDNQVTFSDLIIVDNNNTNFVAKVVPPGAPSAIKVTKPVKVKTVMHQ